MKARLDLVGQFFPLQGGLNARNNFIRNYGCGPKIVTFAYEKGPKDKKRTWARDSGRAGLVGEGLSGD